MEENTLQTELIEKYISDQLSEDEKKAFEQRLQEETALAEEVALHRHLHTGIRTAGRIRLLHQLAADDEQMAPYHPPAQIIPFTEAVRKRFYWAAAAVILFLIPLYLILDYNQRSRSDDLFAQYFTPYQETDVDRGSSDPLSAALSQYQKKNYAQALPMLEGIRGSEALQDTTLFIKGNVHLALDQITEAIDCFSTVTSQPGNDYYQEAQWYLALAYLKSKDLSKAKKLLRDIRKEDDHPYQEKAQQLLKDL
jgi:FimV-like protein